MQITFYSYSLFCLKSSVDLLWKIYRCRKNNHFSLALPLIQGMLLYLKRQNNQKWYSTVSHLEYHMTLSCYDDDGF